MTALFMILFSQIVHAEYRAFELVIVSSTTGQERVVISTLDPRQYRKYYPVNYDDQITYRDTWMCKGNTSSHKPVCAKPAEGSGPIPDPGA
jgi:hypothetical protein